MGNAKGEVPCHICNSHDSTLGEMHSCHPLALMWTAVIGEPLSFWSLRCLKLQVHEGRYDPEAVQQLIRHGVGAYLSYHAFNTLHHTKHHSAEYTTAIAYRRYETFRAKAPSLLPAIESLDAPWRHATHVNDHPTYGPPPPSPPPPQC
jgi:hypothetical protein